MLQTSKQLLSLCPPNVLQQSLQENIDRIVCKILINLGATDVAYLNLQFNMYGARKLRSERITLQSSGTEILQKQVRQNTTTTTTTCTLPHRATDLPKSNYRETALHHTTAGGSLPDATIKHEPTGLHTTQKSKSTSTSAMQTPISITTRGRDHKTTSTSTPLSLQGQWKKAKS